MFEELTDTELAELDVKMLSATDAIYDAPWVDERCGNRKGAYHDLLKDLDLIAAEVSGIRAARSWR